MFARSYLSIALGLSEEIIQNGPSFYRYDEREGDYVDIASYPTLVRDDYDVTGARVALMQFACDHPEFIMHD